MGRKSGSHIERRGEWYRYRRRVPLDLVELAGRAWVKAALDTADRRVALERAQLIDRELEALWAAQRAGRLGDADARRCAVEALAAAKGFAYTPAAELAKGPLDEILKRLSMLEASGALEDRNIEALSPEREALLGTAPARGRSVSDALERYFELTLDQHLDKSDAQLKRAQAPKRKAVKNLEGVIGAVPFDAVSRQHAMQFRDWLQARMTAGEIGANAANKDLHHLSALWNMLDKIEQSGRENPWSRLTFREKKRSRSPIPIAWVSEHWFAPGALDCLNLEARDALLALVNTGARPIEILGLEASDIDLEGDVPHIIIRANATRALKNEQSARTVPLLGVSLEAMRRRPAGFERYRGKSDTFSAAVNKTLRAHSLLPSPNHSIYGLRHGFEDRLIGLDCPERTKADLMGHELRGRPRYGAGPQLEKAKEWIERIAI